MAIRDALDRAGLKPVTAVDLEVSTKPWEAGFEGILKVVAGPRNLPTQAALQSESGSAAIGSGNDRVIRGEIDDDPLPEATKSNQIRCESNESGNRSTPT